MPGQHNLRLGANKYILCCAILMSMHVCICIYVSIEFKAIWTNYACYYESWLVLVQMERANRCAKCTQRGMGDCAAASVSTVPIRRVVVVRLVSKSRRFFAPSKM